MQRGMFPIFDEVYAFVRELPPDAPRPLPLGVQDALWVLLVLLPLLQASLDRAWLGEITATDSSSEYGFGAAYAQCSPAEVASLGRLAEQRGD